LPVIGPRGALNCERLWVESNEFKPHLQSFFLAFDLNARTRPFLNEFWDDFRYVVNKQALIRKYELGLSARARKAGLRIKPYVGVDAITDAYALAPRHQWAHKFSGSPINNTLYFYDGLIEHLRFSVHQDRSTARQIASPRIARPPMT
jgi:hypothetical protein